MWPQIVRRGYAGYTGPHADVRIKAAWAAFRDQRGQEHWHCDCALTDEAVANLKPKRRT